MLHALRVAVDEDAEPVVEAIGMTIELIQELFRWLILFRIDEKQVRSSKLSNQVNVISDVLTNLLRIVSEDEISVNMDDCTFLRPLAHLYVPGRTGI